jgi:hypothetical protein
MKEAVIAKKLNTHSLLALVEIDAAKRSKPINPRILVMTNSHVSTGILKLNFIFLFSTKILREESNFRFF